MTTPGSALGRFAFAAFRSAWAALAACSGEHPVSPSYPPDPGPWILDSAFVQDDFPFRTDACAEVFPAGSISAPDSLPKGSVASVRLTVTSCYALTVRVVDSDSDTVRTFSTRFSLFNRSEDEKNRGVVSYAAWDGKDDAGNALGSGRYLWRMEFDFGLGRLRRYRADIWVP